LSRSVRRTLSTSGNSDGMLNLAFTMSITTGSENTVRLPLTVTPSLPDVHAARNSANAAAAIRCFRNHMLHLVQN
jgi:hypothetical protein